MRLLNRPPNPESLRRDALACIRAAIVAVEPAGLVASALAGEGRPAGGVTHPTPGGAPVAGPGPYHLVAVGKAAAAMAAGAVSALGDGVAGGVVLVPRGTEAAIPPLPAGVRVFPGGHPDPDGGSVAGAQAVAELAGSLGEGDHLLCLLSGGGSALLTLPPPGISVEEVARVTRHLLRSGADIREVNTVRKRLDRLKGGGLARWAAPARVTALILSDVPGEDPSVIASGPLSPDQGSFAEAVAILRERGVWGELPGTVRAHLEAGQAGVLPEPPRPGDSVFRRVEFRIVGTNRMALEGARREAERRGYRTTVLAGPLIGEARKAGAALARQGLDLLQGTLEPGALPLPLCLLAGGETTVTVRGPGRGGRNQEVALGAAQALEGVPGILLASAGTDGVDGPTDAAGAMADGDTLRRARALGLDPLHALEENDAYPFFQALGDLIVTGPTGTNVMDVQVVLVAPSAS